MEASKLQAFICCFNVDVALDKLNFISQLNK